MNYKINKWKNNIRAITACLALIILFSPVFSQARLNIFNNAFVSMGGGTSGNPVYLVMENGSANAINRSGNGNIISENEHNKLKWIIGTNTGVYTFPLGKNTSDYFSFYLNKTTAGDCPVSPCSFDVASWYTLNNATLPDGITMLYPGEDAAVDRFWRVNLSGYTANPVSDARFYYLTSELDGLDENDLVAQRWNSATSEWDTPLGTVNTTDKYVEVTALSQFSPWTLVDTDNPLPIELLTFTAQWKNNEQKEALLTWKTASEINNDFFEIQRSEDAISFRTLGTTPGAGNSQSEHTYAYTDQPIPAGTTCQTFYYRLKQVDYNGRFSYSNTITLTRNKTNNGSVSLYPNPATNMTQLSMSMPVSAQGEIVITNQFAQVVMQKTVYLQKGENHHSLLLSQLPAGIYYVKIVTNEFAAIHKLTISQ